MQGQIDGSTLSKWILEKQGLKVWSGFNWLREMSNGMLYEHSDEILVHKAGNLLTSFKEDCTTYCYCLRGGISPGIPNTAVITDLLCVPI
jgi:hypothetical protein